MTYLSWFIHCIGYYGHFFQIFLFIFPTASLSSWHLYKWTAAWASATALEPIGKYRRNWWGRGKVHMIRVPRPPLSGSQGTGHLLLLWSKEWGHSIYSFTDTRILPTNEKALSFYLQVVYYCVNILYRGLYEINSHMWLLIFCHSVLSTTC